MSCNVDYDLFNFISNTQHVTSSTDKICNMTVFPTISFGGSLMF